MRRGLILEGGGMRGIFVAGVLEYFLEKDVRFDHVIGVSAGSCHGASYCSGQKGRAYETSTKYLDRKEYCSLWSLRTTGDMFGAEFVYHTIPRELSPIDQAGFEKRGMKFQAVVTNCETGESEYPVITDMLEQADYIRASCSLPFLANMVPLDAGEGLTGGLYMDGGIADSIPLAQSIRQGNEKHVIVLTRPRGYRKSASKMGGLMRAKYRKYPGLVRALKNRHKVYNETLELIEREEAAGRAFVIAPIGPLDLGRIEKDPEKMQKAYREGYYVAEALYEKMMAYLEK